MNKQRIKLSERNLQRFVKSCINEAMNEMAVTKKRLEKGSAYVDEINALLDTVQQETGECSVLDLSNQDEIWLDVVKRPKMYKNGLVVFAVKNPYLRDVETFKCSFDKEKNDEYFGKFENAQKQLNWLKKCANNALRHLQEYDVNWEDESDPQTAKLGRQNIKSFYGALRRNRPFEPKSLDESIRKAIRKVLK